MQALVAANSATGADVARLSQLWRRPISRRARTSTRSMSPHAYPLWMRQRRLCSNGNCGSCRLSHGKIRCRCQASGNAGAERVRFPTRSRAQARSGPRARILPNSDPLRVVTLLTAAAREEPTFYGLLAEHMLGQDTDAAIHRSASSIRRNFAALSMRSRPRTAPSRSIRSAKWHDLHEEMSRALAAMDYSQAETFCAAAEHMNIPDLELRASETGCLDAASC